MHAVPAARRALPCARGVSKTSFVSSHAPPHLTMAWIKGCEEAWEQLQSLRVNERENLHENCEADSEGGDARQWKVFTA